MTVRASEGGDRMGRIAGCAGAALALLLACAGGAAAGGFSTVGLSSLPDGVAAGRAWTVEVDVRSHGIAPQGGLRPAVVIAPVEAGAEAGADRRFAARPTATTGIYRARVVFPSGGTWSYAVDEGYGFLHA